MKFLLPIFLTFAGATALAIDANPSPDERLWDLPTTKDRIEGYGYPVEEHSVQTADAYILKMFRIPNSHKRNCPSKKPIAFLQHGLLSSSDCWILNGPRDALAYLLADACYDVWMGNFRGNTYSKKHAKLSSINPSFWDFSWNEMGHYDLPAMIDYVLYKTGQDALHYIGHSQGTTTFMIMLSQIPRYNDKIKTSHMLAPVGYMEYMDSIGAKLAGPILGQPTLIGDLMGNSEFLPSNKLFSLLGSAACAEKSIFQPMCTNILFLIAGWDSQHLNYTLMSDVMMTHPAGAATNQLIHYLQEHESGHFRKFDHGLLNKQYYGTSKPPDYWIQNIRAPMIFYYSDNDDMAAVRDVLRMRNDLFDYVELYHVPFPDWNHLDYLFAIDVKPVINDKVLNEIKKWEQKN